MQTVSQTGQQTTVNRTSKTDSSATVRVTDARHTRIESETLTEQADEEEVVTTIREYDTSLPADTVTGTPPLRREITRTRRKTGSARQVQTTDRTTARHRETDAEAKQQRTDTRTEQNDSHRQDTAAIQVDTKEKRGLSIMQRMLCIAGVVAIGAGIVWSWRKLKRHL